jgi:predicted alpha/beta superfamily hydrolase
VKVGPSGPATLRRAEAFDVTSADGAAFRILVGLPASYDAGERAYPVLYVLDGETFFPLVHQLALLRASVGELQEVVVVGIDATLDDPPGKHGARRMYEFTAAEWDTSSYTYREQEAMLALTGETLRLGGAPGLLRFLGGELQPFVCERYRVDADDQGLFGCSGGGSFVGYALFQEPRSFRRYIAASPGFYFNDFGVLRWEAGYAAAHDDLPVTLYLGAGSEEAKQYAAIPILSGTVQLAEALQRRRYPGLQLHLEVLDHKNHFTAATDVIQRGLEACWPGLPFECTTADDRERERLQSWAAAGEAREPGSSETNQVRD